MCTYILHTCGCMNIHALKASLTCRQSTYDPEETELHPPRPRSASSMHATSVERRSSSGKRKAPLAKRASVDDIAAYGVDMTDGEV